MVFIHVYHSKAWLVDDCRDPALEINITTIVTGAATIQIRSSSPIQKLPVCGRKIAKCMQNLDRTVGYTNETKTGEADHGSRRNTS